MRKSTTVNEFSSGGFLFREMDGHVYWRWSLTDDLGWRPLTEKLKTAFAAYQVGKTLDSCP